MNLVIDVGNSSAKLGLFTGNELIEQVKKESMEDIILYVNEQKPRSLLIASVASDFRTIANEIDKNINLLFFNNNTPIPIINRYNTPESLGNDRLAAAVGANLFFPGQHCLSVDVGTCITYDFIDEEGAYLGGGISPGVAMKLKALNTFTQRLPLVEPTGEAELIGTTTKESILSGVLNGTLAEIEEIINRYSNIYKNLKIIICGGDAFFFDSRIKATIFVVPELVLFGLNRILQYNVSP
jgi:type III pantothenate kinase